MEDAAVTIDGSVLLFSFAPYPENTAVVPDPGTALNGTLRGSVTTAGVPAGAPPGSVPNAVIALRTTDSPTGRIGLDADSHGQFTIHLAPGTYDIEAAHPMEGGGNLTCTAAPLTVTADNTVNVDLTCKIR